MKDGVWRTDADGNRVAATREGAAPPKKKTKKASKAAKDGE